VAAPPSNQTLLPLYESDDITVSALNKNVLIMQITSFEPANNSVFLDVVWETLNLADAFDVPYLILDLRGNGGGDICLGYQVRLSYSMCSLLSLITKRRLSTL